MTSAPFTRGATALASRNCAADRSLKPHARSLPPRPAPSAVDTGAAARNTQVSWLDRTNPRPLTRRSSRHRHSNARLSQACATAAALSRSYTSRQLRPWPAASLRNRVVGRNEPRLSYALLTPAPSAQVVVLGGFWCMGLPEAHAWSTCMGRPRLLIPPFLLTAALACQAGVRSTGCMHAFIWMRCPQACNWAMLFSAPPRPVFAWSLLLAALSKACVSRWVAIGCWAVLQACAPYT
eukprot:354070-Chlamydomonas_euryale.AAC.5